VRGERTYRHDAVKLTEDQQYFRQLDEAEREIKRLQHQVQSWERRAEVARRLLSAEVKDRKQR
jgi:hypothetical protein